MDKVTSRPEIPGPGRSCISPPSRTDERPNGLVWWRDRSHLVYLHNMSVAERFTSSPGLCLAAASPGPVEESRLGCGSPN